jgi:hypothetical protein
MHRSLLRVGFVVGTLLIVFSQSLTAKAPTVRLTIAGPGLPAPVDTTAPEALASIWAGPFIGGPADEPDTSLPRYLITFYVRWWEQGWGETIKPKYVVWYVHDPRTKRGFVYLPGRGEDGYSMNAQSMSRDGQDGRWHSAAVEWSEAVAKKLP